MKKEKRKYLKFGVIILLIIGLILSLKHCDTDTTQYEPTKELDTDDGAVDWEGHKKPSDNQNGSGIAVPGFKELKFKANQTKQHVNFYNPEVNNCLFVMTLLVENEEYWQSGYVEAGKGYYNIDLYKPLTAGEYKAELKIQCFKSIGTELNSAKVTFDLIVLEDM